MSAKTHAKQIGSVVQQLIFAAIDNSAPAAAATDRPFIGQIRPAMIGQRRKGNGIGKRTGNRKNPKSPCGKNPVILILRIRGIIGPMQH